MGSSPRETMHCWVGCSRTLCSIFLGIHWEVSQQNQYTLHRLLNYQLYLYLEEVTTSKYVMHQSQGRVGWGTWLTGYVNIAEIMRFRTQTLFFFKVFDPKIRFQTFVGNKHDKHQKSCKRKTIKRISFTTNSNETRLYRLRGLYFALCFRRSTQVKTGRLEFA